MYTLYYCPGTASMIVHLTLLEIGAEHELKLVDVEKNQQKDPAYLRLNPNGVVPTLVFDDRPYLESAALLMLLSERHPQAGLVPAAGSVERDQWRQWIMYLSHSLQSAFRAWFYPAELGYEEHTAVTRQALQNRIAAIWDKLDQHLEQNGPYLLGDTFSGADLYLTMLMRWSRNMPRPATGWPALNRLAQLIIVRPSWQKMVAIEGIDVWPKVSSN
ncbi:glutathione S-transferase family protein [Undibacterium sp. CY18W]|uniref:Glutathione S-transferase family protein n=1 Tax=Undibacterium hunanense TaxID=2762292 RepID=A0ABR6ZSR0_9BURK|nr:glutathione S-transferase family protein [Undibacterium hunanense]MBC3918644.1 glutathione S-transferase family protein [Undibacterium hunanense]